MRNGDFVYVSHISFLFFFRIIWTVLCFSFLSLSLPCCVLLELHLPSLSLPLCVLLIAQNEHHRRRH